MSFGYGIIKKSSEWLYNDTVNTKQMEESVKDYCLHR